MDFDRFGIKLADDYYQHCQPRKTVLFLPPNWQACTQSHRDNQQNLFVVQAQQSLIIHQPTLQALQNFVDSHQLAITQENVYHWHSLATLALD